MDAAIYRGGIVNKEYHLCVENTAEGYREMKTRIIGKTGVNREDMLVCMEHTGVYSLTFRYFFEEDGIAYTMVSPFHLKKSSGLARGKTTGLIHFGLRIFAARTGLIFDRADCRRIHCNNLNGCRPSATGM